LHTNGMIVGLNKSNWALYRHGIGTDAGPRIRPALLYSYYGTDENDSPYSADAEALLQCIGPSSCAKGHCP
ncbi:MAG: hypothetical protein AAFQ99_13470, partial [Pseudomonadota bacterium]